MKRRRPCDPAHLERGEEDALPDAPSATLESLDGQMSRASFEGSLSPGTHHEQYALDAGDAIAFLWCSSSEVRRDDWYSIARSIQFTSAAD
jgi:hypothetical protein